MTANAAVLLGLVGAPFAAAASDCPPPPSCVKRGLTPLAPLAVKRMLAAGTPLLRSCALVDGGLDLRSGSGAIGGPVVLRNSCIAGPIRADSTVFGSIVDLSGTTVMGTARFYSAEFDRAAEFAGTDFEGPATFTGAEFRGVAGFVAADFVQQLTANDASFDRGADFSNAEFEGAASFSGASFAQQSRFTDGSFDAQASFYDARFGGGCDFSYAFFSSRTDFDLSTAQGDLGFQHASFGGTYKNGATFWSVLFGGAADFSEAGNIRGTSTFDDAIISSLDLTGARAVFFGEPRRIDELHISADDVAKIGSTASRADREATYRMLGTAARRADDLSAANEAAILRRGLERASKGMVMRQLDWAVEWGIGGYLVRPSHPAVALLIALLLGIVVRCVVNRRGRRGRAAIVSGVASDVKATLGSFRTIKLDGSLTRHQLEPLLYTVLVLVLLANLEAVSPPIRNFMEGLV